MSHRQDGTGPEGHNTRAAGVVILRVATEADDFLVGGLNGFAQAVLQRFRIRIRV